VQGHESLLEPVGQVVFTVSEIAFAVCRLVLLFIDIPALDPLLFLGLIDTSAQLPADAAQFVLLLLDHGPPGYLTMAIFFTSRPGRARSRT
jgi:hypothetical protein